MELKQLNDTFGIAGHIEFISGQGGFILAKIANGKASALVSLYGAHIQSFVPKDQKELLWMSPQSAFEAGKAIRGGIPVCFPWFGPHATDNQKPMHGFARLSNWEVTKTSVLVNGETALVLALKDNVATQAIWPCEFSAEIKIIVGATLDVTLTYFNTGKESFICSDALHSYFNISNTANIGISGLRGHRYYAGFAKDANNTQEEEILLITKEENRRYINHTADCIISDKVWNRKIRVGKRGSKVTVVWNPWEAMTKTMSDIPNDGYTSFVCIEAANYYDDCVNLKPGESHSIATVIGAE